MPATYDLSIWRGANPELGWLFRNPDESLFDLTGSRMILTVWHRGRKILEKDTSTDGAEFLINVATATLIWSPDVSETRGLPLGRLARYELERWIGGEQRTLVKGYLVVQGGDNIDA